jgi:MFS family permease
MGYLLARRFGTRNFGKIYGINYFAFTFGAGLGPATLHFVAGSAGGYTLAFTTFALLGLIAPIMLLLEWKRSDDRRTRAI